MNFVGNNIALAASQEDDVAQDIFAVRQYIIDQCESWKSLKTSKVSAKDLLNKIKEVGISKIKIVDQVSLKDGIPRSAINDSQTSEITFGRFMWKSLNGDTIRKVGIVLHEYLGLMKIEKTDDYHVSEQVLRELRVRALLGGPDAAFIQRPLSVFKDSGGFFVP